MKYMSIQELFYELVRIDSPSGEEQAVADFVTNYLKALGFSAEKDEHGNVYSRIGKGSEPILLCNHLDTVEPGRNIEPIEEDGVIRSEGETILGADNKAAVAALLFSVAQTEDELNIELLFTVEEETNSGIKNFDASRLASKTAVVIDGGGGSLAWVAAAAPTISDFEIRVTGKASHSSNPEAANSVLPFVTDFIERTKPGRIDSDTTFNIGVVSAGSAVNTVPAGARIIGDIRSSEHASYESKRDEVESVLIELAAKHGVQVSTDWLEYCRSYTIDTGSEFYKNLAAAYASIGIALDPVSTTSASDAGYLRANGIEAYCLGDGVDSPHETAENISIENLNKLGEIFTKIIRGV